MGYPIVPSTTVAALSKGYFGCSLAIVNCQHVCLYNCIFISYNCKVAFQILLTY